MSFIPPAVPDPRRPDSLSAGGWLSDWAFHRPEGRIILLQFLGSIPSGLFTATGLYAIWDSIAVAMVMTLLIQGTVLICLDQLSRPAHQGGRRLATVSALAIALLFSIQNGHAGLLYRAYATSWSRDELRLKLADLDHTLTTFATTIDEQSKAMNGAAVVAGARAEIEATHGGTCGDNSGKGAGPRFELISDDAARLHAWARAFSQASVRMIGDDGLVERARRMMKTLGKVDEASIDPRIAALSGLLNDGRSIVDSLPIDDVRQYAKQRLEIEQHGLEVEGAGGVTYRIFCRDPELRRLLETIVVIKRTELPAAEEIIRSFRGERSELNERVFRLYLVAPSSWLISAMAGFTLHPKRQERPDTAETCSGPTCGWTSSDRLVLYYALTIDSLLVLLELVKWSYRRRRLGENLLEAFAGLKHLDPLFMALFRHIRHYRGQHLFVIHYGVGNARQMAEARRLLAMLKAIGAIASSPEYITLDAGRQDLLSRLFGRDAIDVILDTEEGLEKATAVEIWRLRDDVIASFAAGRMDIIEGSASANESPIEAASAKQIR